MSGAELLDLLERIGPVLIFLVAITVVAEIADLAGVFDVAAHWTARAGRHRVAVLWLLFCALAVGLTVVLSLDTTAVLLTPVGIALARQVGIPPLPFAMTTLWFANTASLLLPVSNLTNLLALHQFSALGESLFGYVRLLWAPALAAIVATTAVLWLIHRRELVGRYLVDPPDEPHDRVLLRVAAWCTILLGPAFVSGVTPAIPASIAALVLVAVCRWRAPAALAKVAWPWRMVLGVCVLFVVVQFGLDHGLRDVLAAAAGSGTDAAATARITGLGMLAANAVNNLPAYLALESAVSSDIHRLAALLIGVNVGSIVTPWGSLATILWRSRCTAAGVSIRPGRLIAESLVCAVVAAGAATAVLALV